MSSVRISAQIRMFVADRANHCCEYCKLPNRYFGAFTIDHVIPTSKGRDSNPQNLAFCCSNCVLDDPVFHIRNNHMDQMVV